MPRALLLLGLALSTVLSLSASAQTNPARLRTHPAANLDLASRRWATPWDVYLACQGVAAAAASVDSAVLRTPEGEKIRGFCGLDLPRIGRRFARLEMERWHRVLRNESMPSDTTVWRTMQDRGEQVLAGRLDLLQRVQVGGTALQFAYGDASLDSGQRDALRAAADSLRTFLEAHPGESVSVVGYADDQGESEAVNRAKAMERAQAAVDVLVQAGIERSRIAVRPEIVRLPTGGRGATSSSRAVELFAAPDDGGSTFSGTATQPPAAGSLDVSTLLVGTADFLLDEAREQIESYVLQQGARRICTDSTWKALLTTTCSLVPRLSREVPRADIAGRRAAELDSVRYFPGIDVVRQTLREDLRTLPFRVGEDALRKVVAGAAGDGIRERAVLGLYLLEYVQEMGQVRSPLDALGRALGAIPDTTLTRLQGEGLQVVARIRQAAVVGDLLRSAHEDLAGYWRPQVLADSAGLYTIKALALNLHLDPASARALGLDEGIAPRVSALVESVRTAQELVHSIERGWQGLRALPDSARVQLRRGLVAQLAADAVDLAFVSFPQGGIGTSADSLRGLASPVRDLVTALSTNNPPEALNSLLRLSLQVQSTDMLQPNQLRALTFATDIAQARQGTDVQAAFGRLVGSGPGYRGKRQGTLPYWRVNAYAGVTGGVEQLVDAGGSVSPTGAAFGLTLPIGVEVGSATAGQSSRGWFFQLVDLGAIASARIGNGDGVKSFPEFSLASVVAPGLYRVAGLSDKPFATLWGLAYVPQARVTAQGEEIGGLRATVSLTVDIPLFP
ncbi:MAG TPA: OmpA family protein [Longimicrobium sp.]|nr:OmpA family protein [Longimicrobium sp.]